MKATIQEQRDQLMESGYLIVRDMIRPDELQRLRKSIDLIVNRAPELTGKMTLTSWVDRDTADAVEFFFDDRTLGFACQLMDVPAAVPLGMWVWCSSGTGWHRDVHPIDMAPLDGLQEDLRLNGPPYLQWNIALYDDSFLQAIPKSHLRRNNAEENKIERRMGAVPLPEATAVDLKAGDGVVNINTYLHSAKPNGETKRRTIHMGYQAFGNKGFTHFFPNTIGVHFIEHLSPRAADQCRQFEKLNEQRNDEIAATFHAILKRDQGAFKEALETLHPSVHGRMTSLIVLSKIAYVIRELKDSNADDYRNTDAVQALAARFAADELDQLWQRFGTLDDKLKADTEQYEPLFQNPAMMYRFYDMPPNFGPADFVASW